tara:strand:- start:5775 stop:7406 length:1632 start_codon:yes stop_codon:yes gene_type:complete
MANGRQRRGLGTLPFPTFNAGGQGGVIPQLQLRPAPIRFPQAGGGGGGGRKEINPAAYFAPGLVSLLSDRFLPQPAIKERQPTGDPAIDRARMQADLIYGAEREDPTLFQELLPMGINALVAAGFGDEGGAQYAQTAINRSIANRDAKRNVDAAKRQFIKEQLAPETAQDLTVIDVNKAKTGVIDTRPAIFLPKSQTTLVHDPKNPRANKQGYVETSDEALKGTRWIDVGDFDTGGAGLSDFFKDPTYKELLKAQQEQMSKDKAILDTVTIANGTIEFLDEAIKDPSKNPTTITNSFLNFGNDLFANFDQIASLNGTRSVDSFFSKSQNGGTLAGTGVNAQNLYNALRSGDEDQIRLASDAFGEAMGIDLKGIMGDASYRNVRTRATLLQLAYMAAAANGQTGRTLSDKDLQYHLEIVGFGASQDPRVLKANLLAFIDSLEKGADTQTMVYLPKEGMGRFNMQEKQAQSIIGMYYDPITGEDGNKQWENYLGYTFRPFSTRYKDNPEYKIFKQHQRPSNVATGGGTGTTDDTDISELETILQG